MEQSIGFSLKLKWLLVLCAGFIEGRAMAQGEPFVIGAQAWGVGNATVASTDPANQGGNIAGVAETKEPYFLAAYDTYYNFPGIGIFAVAATVPIRNQLATTVGVVRFGDALYHELQASLGLAHRIERVSLGMRTTFLQQAFNIPSMVASRQSVVVDMGGQVLLGSQLRLGAHAYNLFRAAYSGELGAAIPTILKLGFQYEPSEKLSVASELYKHTSRPVVIRAGINYQPIPFLSLRTGISAGPMTHHFGLGVQARPFFFDYAVHTHSRLGWSHHISIGYSLQGAQREGVEQVQEAP